MEGKYDVLECPENESLTHTNENPGVYALQRDDDGNLVLFLAGHAFIGSGTVSLGGNLLDVINGQVVKIQKP